MSDYDNTNSGAIFVNNKKTTDNHPDRNGTLNVDGVEYWISGWLKKSKNGDPFMSLSVKRKEAAPAPKSAAPVRKALVLDDDGSIPF